MNEFSKILTSNQIHSYDSFVDSDMHKIIKHEPVNILVNPKNNEFQTMMKIIFDKIKVSETDETPHCARLNGRTYKSSVDVEVTFDISHYGENVKVTKDLKLIDLPTMVYSNHCKLNNESTKTTEAQNEYGGYFIINGLEKIIVSQEDSVKNKIYSLIDSQKNYNIVIDSSIDDTKKPDRFAIRFDEKINDFITTIQYFKADVPIMLLLKALGFESDYEIFNEITGGSTDSSDSISNIIYDNIVQSFLLSQPVNDSNVALKMLSIITKHPPKLDKKTNEESNTKEWQSTVIDLLYTRLLPHLNVDGETIHENFRKKGIFVCNMLRELILIKNDIVNISDRDTLKMKKVRLPGNILIEMFREFFLDYKEKMYFEAKKLLKDSENLSISDIENILTEEYMNVLNTIDFQKNINKSFMGKWGKDPMSKRNEGVLQTFTRHTLIEYLSHIRRVHLYVGSSGNTMQQRRLHNSQYGFYCPIETPDGQKVGTHKHMSHTCHFTKQQNELKVLEFKKYMENNILPVLSNGLKNKYEFTQIYFDGVLLGYYDKNTIQFVKKLKEIRRDPKNHLISWMTSIAFNIKRNILEIYTIPGRMIRPLIPSELINKIQLTEREKLLAEPENLINKGCEFVDSHEIETYLVGFPENRNDEYTHYEISRTSSLGIASLTLPFLEYNPVARNRYATSHARQAVSMFSTEYNNRMDQKANLLNYTTRPLVGTGLFDELNQNKNSYGFNAIVAIATFNGFNQEDSIIVSKTALENGLFHTTAYATFSEKEEKQIKDELLIFNPNFTDKKVILNKSFDYSNLDENGVIKKNIILKKNAVLIGCFRKNGDTYVDESVVFKKNATNTYVDRVYLSKDPSRIARVRVRQMRIPITGDKLASRQAQKATIGLILDRSDMPYDSQGVTPDIIFNPHSFPSRMTMGFFLEALFSEYSLLSGSIVTVPVYSGIENLQEKITKKLNTMNRNNDKRLFSGETGKKISDDCKLISIFYERLKQQVEDKIFAAGDEVPIDQLTRQPVGGRAKGGALKVGNMERDTILSHGASLFLKESFVEKADGTNFKINKENGELEETAEESQDTVKMPYAMKLLKSELAGFGIDFDLK